MSNYRQKNLVAGILDDETVIKHISKINKTVDVSSISYLTLTLPVSLKNCYRLQYLSLAHNRISQLEELDGLPPKYLNLVG
ncbi:unnamed protein product [Rotaria sp. Silwood1]|nr:unnamed protein product [Rotaria sp. Silwood1]CAF5061404.1 unnamed protein product [Rotaria sp. Silwood1]